MSKNLVVLFLGAFLFAFIVAVEGLGAGCDPGNCKGVNETGTGRTLACNSEFVYSSTAGKCVQKDQAGSVGPNCKKSGTVEANCGDCRCSYKNDDQDRAACKCRHKDLASIGY